MKLIELYADSVGETHFRELEIVLEAKQFAPPSPSIDLSSEWAATTAVLVRAPFGWDEEFHSTPRPQIAEVLSGEISMTTSGGETRKFGAGSAVFLNDEDSRGHQTLVLNQSSATFLLVGLSSRIGTLP